MQQRGKSLLDRFQEARSDHLRRFGGKVSPDLGQIGLSRLGQSEDERDANSFLPRSTICLVSKSFTRPAATSARPCSMSVLRAVSSCSWMARFIFHSRSASRTTSLVEA